MSESAMNSRPLSDRMMMGAPALCEDRFEDAADLPGADRGGDVEPDAFTGKQGA